MTFRAKVKKEEGQRQNSSMASKEESAQSPWPVCASHFPQDKVSLDTLFTKRTQRMKLIAISIILLAFVAAVLSLFLYTNYGVVKADNWHLPV